MTFGCSYWLREDDNLIRKLRFTTSMSYFLLFNNETPKTIFIFFFLFGSGPKPFSPYITIKYKQFITFNIDSLIIDNKNANRMRLSSLTACLITITQMKITHSDSAQMRVQRGVAHSQIYILM